MNFTEISIGVLSGGQSQKVTLTAASGANRSTAISASTSAGEAGDPVVVLITPDVNCFVRYAAGTPTALNDGTDQRLLANNTYRATVMPGGVFAFYPDAAGTVYLTPRA